MHSIVSFVNALAGSTLSRGTRTHSDSGKVCEKLTVFVRVYGALTKLGRLTRAIQSIGSTTYRLFQRGFGFDILNTTAVEVENKNMH
jgi:hypothetical protein